VFFSIHTITNLQTAMMSDKSSQELKIQERLPDGKVQVSFLHSELP